MAINSIHRTELPAHALLRRYLRDGHYADCYVVEVPVAVSQAEFVEAFYTTPLFKLERAILAAAVRKPSTDDDARALARGEREAFADENIVGVHHPAQDIAGNRPTRSRRARLARCPGSR